MKGARWRMNLFGEPRLEPADASCDPLRLAAVDTAWICVLAMDGPLARDTLISRVWASKPDDTESKARGRLKERLSRLRRDVARLAGRPVRLFEIGSTASIVDDLEPLRLPTLEVLANDPRAWDPPLAGAHDFTHWPPFETWLAEQRERFSARRQQALQQLGDAAEADGRYAPALAFAQRWIEDAPLCEPAHRALIRRLYLMGDRAAALTAFDRFKVQLHEELHETADSETLALVESIGAGRIARAAEPLHAEMALRRPTRLVGRDDALQSLRQLAGGGGLLIVRGEAGMGKTRLVEEAFEDRNGVILVRSTTDDPPWALARAVLRSLGEFMQRPRHAASMAGLGLIDPGMGDPVAGTSAQQRDAAAAACRQLLKAACDAGLRTVVWEDVHHADAQSTDLMALVMAGPAAPCGVGFVLTARPVKPELPLVRALAERAGLDMRELVLRRLNAEEVQDLVAAMPWPQGRLRPPADALLRHTGGNPYYILETLRAILLGAGCEELPRPLGVEQMLDRRLQLLTPEALQLARLAAAAGPHWNAELAEGVLGRSELDLADPWRELEDCDIFHHGRFAHDLVAEAARRSMPNALARRLHGRLARWFDGRSGMQEQQGKHWMACGDFKRAGQSFHEAGRQAVALQRYDDAERLLELAARASDEAGDEARCWSAKVQRVEVIRVARGPAAADAYARELNRDELPPAQSARLLLSWAEALNDLGRPDEAVRQVEAARGRFRAAGQPEGEFDCAILCGTTLASAGRISEARPVVESVREFIASFPDPRRRAQFAGLAGHLAYAQGDSAVAAREFEEVRRLGLLYSEAPMLHTATANLTAIRLTAGDAAAALELALEARQITVAMDSPPLARAVDAHNLAQALLAQGKLGSVVDLAVQALGDQDLVEPWRGALRRLLTVCWARLGQRSRALQLLAEPSKGPELPAAEAQRSIVELELRRLGTLPPTVVRTPSDAVGVATPSLAGMVRLFSLDSLAPEVRWREAHQLHEQALQRDLRPLRLASALVLAEAAPTESPDLDDRPAFEALSLIGQTQVWGLYEPELLWRLYTAATRHGWKDVAAQSLQRGREAVHRCLDTDVPPFARDSYLHRNPWVQGLLARTD